MSDLIIPENSIKVTSLQIAEWTGKEHKNITRDIAKEIEDLGELGKLIFEPTSYTDTFNRKQPCYTMDKDGVMQLALKYDAMSRYKCIQKLKELESQQLQPKQYTLKESLQMNLQLLEDNEKLQKEKEIADKRAFTSMGKLGGITKEVNRLKEEVGDGKLYKTIKAMEIKHNKKFHWKKLKDYSLQHGFEIKKISDPLYDEVNAYHIDVWKVIFGI